MLMQLQHRPRRRIQERQKESLTGGVEWEVAGTGKWSESTNVDYWLGQGAEVGRDEFLICSIARSTWMRKFAIRWIATSSSASNCGQPPRKGRTLTFVPSGMMEPMSNPLSVIMESPRSYFSRSLLLFLSYLSEILPPQRLDKKHITPFGVTPTRSLRVLVFL